MSLGSAKTCSNCHKGKRLSHYYPGSNKCKTCTLEASRVRRQRARDAASEPSNASESWGESLYVMTNPRVPGEVKIGRAAHPLGRARQMSSGHNFTLEVTHTYAHHGALENEVHQRLAQWKVPCGSREWFSLQPEQADLLVRATILEHELSRT